MWRRKVLMALLAMGAVGGYASGFAQMRRARQWHHEQMVQSFAQRCADAALDARHEAGRGKPAM